ncbi:MAG: hypothetical protein GF419_12890 [Ignavibacteriales bacterium]|nr:hypothetical protein [Ignavibacteriales bacterium]
MKLGKNIHRIIIHFGILVFCISIIYFGQKDLTMPQVVLRSMLVFVIITITLSVLALVFVKTFKRFGTSGRKSDSGAGLFSGGKSGGNMDSLDNNLFEETDGTLLDDDDFSLDLNGFEEEREKTSHPDQERSASSGDERKE